jgi:PhzF family phenazine biosynthesis protein
MRSFKQVDVFTNVPFQGNPVAVVLDAQGLDTAQMQKIARWTNLSETTFVFPPSSTTADYLVRIFTPESELPFAGHPTIGTAYALLESELIQAKNGKLIQECKAGLIDLYVDDSNGVTSISFDLPKQTVTVLNDEEIAELNLILGVKVDEQSRPRIVDVGARWLVAQLSSAESVLKVSADFERMKVQDARFKITGVTIFGRHAEGMHSQIEVRSFAPNVGVDEDPVCGSGNGCVAAFIRDTNLIETIGASYLASQGKAVGRAGLIQIDITDSSVRVGGSAVTCIDGVINVGMID